MRKRILYVLFLTALMIGLIYFLSSDLVPQKPGELVDEEEIDPNKSATEQEVIELPDLSEFAETKEMALEIEGTQEKLELTRHSDQDNSYVIYVDEERFTFEDGLTQTITANESPLSSLSIEFVPDQTITSLADTRMQQLREDFRVGGLEEVTDPLEAFSHTGTSDSERFTVYLLENPGKTGVFVLTVLHPLAASEGFGVRLDAMAGTFSMIDTRETK
ncbi:hypothetical protein [Paenisporosarcina cavernae]|uniref:Uncharacterized protein n=1 Tax=Paenisporosarcina cavernae TaxID=2320858 RepID=A0A385YY14_9BACL|nr:hypothetical protein [Paenisporosarcina cavernae]AYC30352.1 hypothetical protein D3873_11095 [Paenisporosarcina cavernae]